MIWLYAAIFLVSAVFARIRTNGTYGDSLSVKQGDSVKGVCILLVFARHVWPYVVRAGWPDDLVSDRAGHILNAAIGQLMVAPFLFYSGYGIMESVKRRGMEYVRTMPRRRIVNTLINFDIAVLLFCGFHMTTGRQIYLKNAALALTGWIDLGNSNWYIFDIICLYAIFWAILAFFGRNKIWPGTHHFFCELMLLTAITACFALALRSAGKNWYWFNTILCFPAGAWFSCYQNEIDSSISKVKCKSWCYVVSVFCMLHLLSIKDPLVAGNLAAVVFMFLLVEFTRRIEIGNATLRWLGRHLFPIYIYQKLPMMFFASCGDNLFVRKSPMPFVMVCFASTVLISTIYSRISARFHDRTAGCSHCTADYLRN